MFPGDFAGKAHQGFHKEVNPGRRDPDKPFPFCITLSFLQQRNRKRRDYVLGLVLFMVSAYKLLLVDLHHQFVLYHL
jgi:hypothetical protein